MSLEDGLHKILGDFGAKLVDDLADSLVRNEVVGGGGSASQLAGSIQYRFMTGKSQGIEITMNDYWQWVEDGRKKGKKPPIDKLIAWIKWKGITPKLSDKVSKRASLIKDKKERNTLKQKSRDAQIKSMAFAIATNIGKHGTIKRDNYKGTKFIEEVITDGRVEELEEMIAKEFGIQLTVDLTKILKDGN